jgi:hypothetical protein
LEEVLLRQAALASDPATKDPIDLSILGAVMSRGLIGDLRQRLEFVPFDPSIAVRLRNMTSGGQFMRCQRCTTGSRRTWYGADEARLGGRAFSAQISRRIYQRVLTGSLLLHRG